MYQPPGRQDVIITIARDGGQLPDPATFAVAADRAASRRSASIVTVHTADTIISIVTVDAPSWFAARAVARAVVSDALESQASSPGQSDVDARRRAGQAVEAASPGAGLGGPRVNSPGAHVGRPRVK